MSLTKERRDDIRKICIRYASDALRIDVLALLDALEESELVLAEERQINADNRRQIRGLQAQLATAQETIAQLRSEQEVLNRLWREKCDQCDDKDTTISTLRTSHQASVEALKRIITAWNERLDKCPIYGYHSWSAKVEDAIVEAKRAIGEGKGDG